MLKEEVTSRIQSQIADRIENVIHAVVESDQGVLGLLGVMLVLNTTNLDSLEGMDLSDEDYRRVKTALETLNAAIRYAAGTAHKVGV